MHLSMIDRAVRLLKHTNIQGEVAEFGVFQGGGFCTICELLKRQGCEGHRMFGFDTFEGMPPSEVLAGDETDKEWAPGALGNTSYEAVQERVKNAGFEATLIKGVFNPSVPLSSYGIEKIALAHIDADIYEGYRDALKWITPHLQVGSVLLMDESEPCVDPRYFTGVRMHGQRALHEWWAENAISMLHIRSQWTVALYVIVDKDYLAQYGEWIARELMRDNFLECICPEFRLDVGVSKEETLARLRSMFPLIRHTIALFEK